MVRDLKIIVAAVILTFSCADPSSLQPENPPELSATGWKSFGEGVSLTERIAIESILNRPDEFAGRNVAVEGTIVGVCRMKGCWIELESSPGQRIQLKVEDDVIVFPTQAYGSRAVAQGIVQKQTFDRTQAVARARHAAQERGLEFEPQSVQPPYEEIRLLGTGALIEVPTTR